MEQFGPWWQALQPLNQWFFIGAMFFSVLFLWQLIMAVVGLSGGQDLDAHVDSSFEHQGTTDAADTVAAFKMLSIQSILAYFTLFTWAGALYMKSGTTIPLSLIYAVVWGLAAMVIVSWVLFMMRKLTSSGNLNIESCVGSNASVFLDIPADGTGEVRLLCNGAMTHLKARSVGGVAIKSGATVRVMRVAGPNTLEVEVSN